MLDSEITKLCSVLESSEMLDKIDFYSSFYGSFTVDENIKNCLSSFVNTMYGRNAFESLSDDDFVNYFLKNNFTSDDIELLIISCMNYFFYHKLDKNGVLRDKDNFCCKVDALDNGDFRVSVYDKAFDDLNPMLYNNVDELIIPCQNLSDEVKKGIYATFDKNFVVNLRKSGFNCDDSKVLSVSDDVHSLFASSDVNRGK